MAKTSPALQTLAEDPPDAPMDPENSSDPDYQMDCNPLLEFARVRRRGSGASPQYPHGSST